MMRNIFAIIFILFSMQVFAEELSTDGLILSTVSVDPNDVAAIKRGAKIFAANCLSCHTLKYLRYDKIAQEAGITIDKMPLNVNTWPLGIRPPDLSLEADIRGVDWIYTYLHSFYLDAARPTGVNNLLVPNTAMPAILAPYQGDFEILPKKQWGHGVFYNKLSWYDILEQTKQGTISPDEYDAMVKDLVSFLDYAAEPFKAEQHAIGYWVLGFLVILFVMMYLLKKEYWRDVKKRRND